MKEYTDEIIKLFWERIVRPNDNGEGCWQWSGITDKGNLPIISKMMPCDSKSTEFSGRRTSLFIDGRLPEGKFVAQSVCNNRECLNPKHLIISNEERFWSKVDKNLDPNGCWLWTAGKDKDNYGKFKITDHGKKIYERAHIYSYRINVGPIADCLLVCHVCDMPNCVNYMHLFLGTAKDNIGDMIAKDRQAKGENKPQHKLTEDDVREIRLIYATKTWQELSDLYGVSKSTIRYAAIGKTWAHVK